MRRRSKILHYGTTPVEEKPTLNFSLVGLTYTCMLLFMGLAAINSQVNLSSASSG